MDLSAIERAKIDCAEKLFNFISTTNVKYHKVATYQDLIDGNNKKGVQSDNTTIKLSMIDVMRNMIKLKKQTILTA